MAQTKIRFDDKGIFVRTNGANYRPGAVQGYAHAYDMTDHGLVKGDAVRVQHLAGNPLCRVTLTDGTKLVWANDYMLELKSLPH